MESEEPPVPVTASPKRDQLVEHNGKVFKTVQEGKAYVLVAPNARTSVDPKAKVKAGKHIHCAHFVIFHFAGANCLVNSRGCQPGARCLLQPDPAIQSRLECSRD